MKQIKKEQKLYAGLQDGFYAFSFGEELGGGGIIWMMPPAKVSPTGRIV